MKTSLIWRKRWRNVAMSSMGLMLVGLIGESSTYAATQPPVSDSYYVASYWYDHFDSDGTPFYPYGQSIRNGATVILDFGAMLNPSSGTYQLDTWQYGTQSISTVKNEISRVLQGYDSQDHSSPMTLIVGTNNSNGTDSSYDWSGMGHAFAGLINDFPPTSQEHIR